MYPQQMCFVAINLLEHQSKATFMKDLGAGYDSRKNSGVTRGTFSQGLSRQSKVHAPDFSSDGRAETLEAT